MTLSRSIARAAGALSIIAAAHATDFRISGPLTPGLHVYPGNVIVDGPLALQGDATIRAVGGYVRVDASITGEGDPGAPGADGELCDVIRAPEPGRPGNRGFDLTIETRPSFLGTSSGDIELRAPISLNGKDGGRGGKGDDNDCPNTCEYRAPQNGARGGDGGRGGNLTVTSCARVLVRYSCYFDSNGGSSGDGGDGGRYAGRIAQDVGGEAGSAGIAGVGGIATFQQSADFHAGDNILFDYGFSMFANGGHGGRGGAGGGSLITNFGDFKGGRPAKGAPGVDGGAGGILRIFGRSKILNSHLGGGPISLWSFGGNGGAGGNGGSSGRGFCECGCTQPYVTCIGTPGGAGGAGGNGGAGGSVDVRNLAGFTIELQVMSVHSRGGTGGVSGASGTSGSVANGCDCTAGFEGVDTPAAGRGGAGGLIWFLTGNTANGTIDVSYSWFGGEGFRGGAGGFGGGGSSCNWCVECNRGGDGGAGGNGGRGSDLSVTGFRMTLAFCTIDLDGGDGGRGGDGGGYEGLGGAGGGAGVDGALVPNGAFLDVTSTTFQDDAETIGETGFDASPCPSGEDCD